MAAFASGIILCTKKDPFGPAIGRRLKPCQGPKQVSPPRDILFSRLPRTSYYAAKIAKEERWVSLSPDTCYTCWTVQLSPNLFRFQSGVKSGTAIWLDEL